MIHTLATGEGNEPGPPVKHEQSAYTAQIIMWTEWIFQWQLLRHLLPFDLQEALWLNCYETTTYSYI